MIEFFLKRGFGLGLGISLIFFILILMGIVLIGLPAPFIRPGIVVDILVTTILFGSGIRIIRDGQRALLTTFEVAREGVEGEMGEGPWWVFPFGARLKIFDMRQHIELLVKFRVETGTNLTEEITLSGEWAILPGKLYAANQFQNLGQTLKEQCKADIVSFLRYVNSREDILEGALLTKLREFILDSADHRLAGNDVRVVGQTWQELGFDVVGKRPSWGVKLYSANFTGMNGSSLISIASEEAAVNRIRNIASRDVGEGMANIMTPTIAAGGNPQLAQQAAQSHMLPSAAPLETIAPSVLIQANDGAPGVNLSVDRDKIPPRQANIANKPEEKGK